MHLPSANENLVELGWTDWHQQALREPSRPDEVLARVVRREGAGLWLDTSERRVAATLSGRLKGAAESALDLPVVGDWALISQPEGMSSEQAVIRRLLARKTTLIRRKAGTHAQPQLLAANIDLVLVVWGLDREPNLGMLERGIAVARAGGIEPAIVLSKTDVAPDWAQQVEALRVRFEVEVIAVSVATDGGIEPLRAQLARGQTAALLGPSGVGKSSLLNGLMSSSLMRVGEVRESDRKGRHTTTHRELFRVPTGGLVVDGPGVRELGLVGESDGEDTPRYPRRGSTRKLGSR
jgi:ribosome biogenesis GTPase / thiamine phosphate phosphatase